MEGRMFLASLLVVMTMATLARAQASTSRDGVRSISVRGECLTKLTSDRGRMSLTAKAVDKNPSAAVARAQEQYSKVLAKVRKLNLKDQNLETDQLRVSEEFDYNNGKRSSRGFQASLGLSVESSEVARLGEILKIAQEEKIDEMGGLQTFVSLQKRKQGKEECLVEALRNAEKKAFALAAAAKTQIGAPLMIVEGGGLQYEPVRPVFFGKAAMKSAGESAPAEVIAGSTDLNVSVDVVYELK